MAYSKNAEPCLDSKEPAVEEAALGTGAWKDSHGGSNSHSSPRTFGGAPSRCNDSPSLGAADSWIEQFLQSSVGSECLLPVGKNARVPAPTPAPTAPAVLSTSPGARGSRTAVVDRPDTPDPHEAALPDCPQGVAWQQAFPPVPAYAFDASNPATSFSTFQNATTVVVSGALPASSPADFVSQLNSWGLAGTYDFFFLPVDLWTGAAVGYAYINFIDPAFVMVFTWIYRKCNFQSMLGLAQMQGLEACRARWEWSFQSDPGQCASWPIILTGQTPSQWAVDAANLLLAPQARAAHFRKTRMCNFFAKGQCRRGAGCSFAHTSVELQPQPTLQKTRLCYAYFTGSCRDAMCAFAHGSRELQLEPQMEQGAPGCGVANTRANFKAVSRKTMRNRLASASLQQATGVPMSCVPLRAAPGPLDLWALSPQLGAAPPLFQNCLDQAAHPLGFQAPQLGLQVPAPWATAMPVRHEDQESTSTNYEEVAPHRDTSEDDSSSDRSAQNDAQAPEDDSSGRDNADCSNAASSPEDDERRAVVSPTDFRRAGLISSSLVRVKGTFIDTFSDELPNLPVRRSRSEGDLESLMAEEALVY